MKTDSPTQRPCSWSTADENVKDGYSFLDDDRRVYLVMTSSTKVLEMPYGARIRCISSVTTDKNDTEHELLETVDYKDSISGKWGKFSQRYRFVQSGEYFNEMELVERNGAPSGRYKFIYASRDCAVLMIEAFDVNMSEGGGEITDTSSGQESSSDAVKNPRLTSAADLKAAPLQAPSVDDPSFAAALSAASSVVAAAMIVVFVVAELAAAAEVVVSAATSFDGAYDLLLKEIVQF
ncbi:hypothetical protein MRX96_035795 [Rhipicephalus microplus]